MATCRMPGHNTNGQKNFSVFRPKRAFSSGWPEREPFQSSHF
uniref:Uncharacterized protein n=1 Tax=Anguilla anguilla TaxID=7936 RepID=A0A0E9PTU4_ANGAN